LLVVLQMEIYDDIVLSFVLLMYCLATASPVKILLTRAELAIMGHHAANGMSNSREVCVVIQTA